MAPINMVHKWLEATDGNRSRAAVQVFLFDHYGKAFDLADHRTLVNKLQKLIIFHRIINWVFEILSNRSQRVKLSKDCLSEWGKIPSTVLRALSPAVFTYDW